MIFTISSGNVFLSFHCLLFVAFVSDNRKIMRDEFDHAFFVTFSLYTNS